MSDHPNRDQLDRLFRGDEFAAAIGAELVDWGGGHAEVALEAAPRHRNFGGWIHGGAMFSVGDVAFAVASNSWGREAVALAIDVQFLAGPAVGDRLVAKAHERARTRRTGAYLIEVSSEGRLIASLHAMVARLNRWHLGEDAWPEDWRVEH